MSQPELLKKVIQTLVDSEVPYMITGSVVSSLQGEPRSTHDIDMVVAIHETGAKKLLTAFTSPGYYLDEGSILEAIDSDGMFNLIDVNSGDKVDFWVLTGGEFDRSRFSRKISVKFMNMEMQVSAPEDTILAKLRWAKLSGGSEKQFTDALRVYEVQYGGLDVEYLDYWVKKLDIDLLWRQLTDEAETI
ncbi:MAG: hypothetical protein DDT20_01290 [Firmicutes bacterium]|nr:hypothetical protein [Bacillota bacterium]